MKKVSFLFALFMISTVALAACGPADTGEGTPGLGATEVFGTETGFETSTPALPGTGEETPTPIATVEPVSPTETSLPTATSSVEITATESVTSTPAIPPTGALDPSRVSQLLDFTLKDRAGENLGEVDDLVLNLGAGCLSYVILSPDAVLGLDNEFIALPWESVSVQGASPETTGEGALVLNVDVDTLQNAPGFNTGEEPDFSTPDWDMEWRDFWMTNLAGAGTITGTGSITGTGTITGTGSVPSMTGASCSLSSQPSPSGEGQLMGPDRTVMAEEFLGTNVQDSEGNSLGEVEDAIIDVKTGEVRYLVVAAGGFLGIGEKLIPVPPQAFAYAASGDEFLTLRVNADVLMAAPTFDLDKLPDSSTAGWDSSIQSYWDQQDLQGGGGAGEGTPEATATQAP